MSLSGPDASMNTQIYQEAGEWVVLFRTGAADAHARERLDAWLRVSPEHVRAYLELTAIWEDTGHLDSGQGSTRHEHVTRARAEENVVSLPSASPFASASAPPASAFAPSPLPPPPLSPPRERGAADPALPVGTLVAAARGQRRRWPALALAACFLVAAAFIGTWLYLAPGTYTTGIGEQRAVILADGSVVELNARTRLRVHLSGTERRVELLEGQALFHVAKDAQRPFIVRSADMVVRAVGTQFDVYRKRAGTIVTVVEGRVVVSAGRPQGAGQIDDPASGRSIDRAADRATDRVTGQGARNSAGGPGSSVALPSRSSTPAGAREARREAVQDDKASWDVLLVAGEQLAVTRGDALKTANPDIAAATAWTRRRLVFNGVPLSEVVEEFNRYNERQLVVENAELQGLEVVGVFSSTDPAALLRFLTAQPGIAVEESHERIRIFARVSAESSPTR